MGVNKVEYGSSTLVDLTGDTVTPETLLQGETAHNAAGDPITGTAKPGVQSFNGRGGSVLPIAGDYSAEQVNYDSNKTVKQVIDALATKEVSDIAGQQSLLKDTVGWTGKNLLNHVRSGSTTIQDITYTVNADKSITAVGTANANNNSWWNLIPNGITLPEGKYIINDGGNPLFDSSHRLSIGMTDGTFINIGGKTEVEITLTDSYQIKEVSIGVAKGETTNYTFKPMIRRADITDPTYEPYHESVEVMYEEEIHGVNLLENTAVSKTENGITFMVNADGSVTVNGTATANTFFVIYPNTVTNKYENNILTGCPAGGNPNNSYCLTSRVGLQSDDSYVRSADDIGNGRIIPKVNTSTEWIRFYIRIANGYTANNLVFKPMIRKADIEDSTYRPYNEQAIQNQLNAQGVLGAKNLLPYPYTYSSRTENGITWTVNADESITINGTATVVTTFRLVYGTGVNLQWLKNKIISVDKSLVGTGVVVQTALEQSPWTSIAPAITDRESLISNVPNDNLPYTIKIAVPSGTTVSNLTLKPMLRLASDPDDTYQPYAMTNRELTESKLNKTSTVLTSSNNLDDIRTTGIYYWKDSIPTNTPENITYAMMEVVKHYDKVTHQIIKKGEVQYQRIYSGKPLAWKSWYKFTGTVVS